MNIFKIAHKLLQERERKGIETYGRALEAFNGRDAIQDAIEETADLLLYLLQVKYERDEEHKNFLGLQSTEKPKKVSSEAYKGTRSGILPL